MYEMMAEPFRGEPRHFFQGAMICLTSRFVSLTWQQWVRGRSMRMFSFYARQFGEDVIAITFSRAEPD